MRLLFVHNSAMLELPIEAAEVSEMADNVIFGEL
jgi:hypothetical protein